MISLMANLFLMDAAPVTIGASYRDSQGVPPNFSAGGREKKNNPGSEEVADKGTEVLPCCSTPNSHNPLPYL
ncbi:hypothetical protein AV530_012947 [Patagioenas fasciata monilis]|uniref:Uncharacterized protein n=1 Tax=Patagioenas fasciata monilis TaxID=372326 RepID=A0A1V4J9D7_PATFA|nr:hypothetical protein AV530_012947 [Patagioenas fasciata monilis]